MEQVEDGCYLGAICAQDGTHAIGGTTRDMVIAELLYTNGAGEVFVLVGDGAPRYRYQEEIRSWVLYTRNGMVIIPRDHVVRMSIKEDGAGSWASEPKQKDGVERGGDK